MGAHLKYKVVEPEQASLANQFLSEQPEHESLEESDSQIIYFSEGEYASETIGEGQVKDSYGSKPSLWAALFEKLHDHDDIEVKILASSCALRLITFTLAELNQVTNNGQAVSGDYADEYQMMIEKANSLDSFPTPFVSKTIESEVVPGDLTEDHLTVLDIFLTFHTETLRMDMLVDYVPITEEDIALPVAELVNEDILIESYDVFYRLNRESETVKELQRIHDQVISTGELPKAVSTGSNVRQ